MMSDRGLTHGTAPAALAHALALTLEPGWWYDEDTGALVAPTGARVAVKDRLPEAARLVPAAPAVARVAPAQRTDPERDLARHVQLVLPAGADLDTWLRRAQAWEGVARVARAPRVSLP